MARHHKLSRISFRSRPTPVTTESAIRQASNAADQAYAKGWAEGRDAGYKQGFNEGKAVGMWNGDQHTQYIPKHGGEQ